MSSRWKRPPYAISAFGRYVAFMSMATNLLGPGGDTNGVSDVFWHDGEQTDAHDVERAHLGLD